MPGSADIKISSLPPAVITYLEKYSTGKWQAEWIPFTPVNTVVVIPSIKEYENLGRLLVSLSESDPEYFNQALFLFVVNNAESAGEEIKEDNRLSLDYLRSLINKKSYDDLSEKIISSGLHIGVIDASSPGLEIPNKDAGVGFARKTGMDIALKLFDYSSPGKKIILCLDADCTVDKNYLTELTNIYNRKNISAAVVDFKHDFSGDSDSSRAIICYEIFLRYYVLGLYYAGSPYAYHSIGSCMSCDYESYIKIEGMNKRKAAEDFYFLEKLGKVLLQPGNTNPFNLKAGIYPVYTTSIQPSSRGSWRVPFGTGQRVNRFLQGSHDEYMLYDPLCFEILKNWLNLFGSSESAGAEYYLRAAGNIHPELYNFLIQQNFEKDWNRIVKNSGSPGQVKKQKVIWFDGFRTMKLVHHLRDTAVPGINMFDALDKIFLLLNQTPLRESGSGIPAPEVQKEYLNYLRDIERKLFT
jgi:hypothetical protein